MTELLRTNDAVLLGYVEMLLSSSEIEVIVLDRNMSAIEGSIGALPRRVMVVDGQAQRARDILEDAGLGAWVARDPRQP